MLISSYEIVRNDLDFFQDVNWNYLILDEGHIIRNSKSRVTKACKSLVANRRLILSGTPIQNSVLELWSLFDFLMPGFLGSESSFNLNFSKPILARFGHVDTIIGPSETTQKLGCRANTLKIKTNH